VVQVSGRWVSSVGLMAAGTTLPIEVHISCNIGVTSSPRMFRERRISACSSGTPLQTSTSLENYTLYVAIRWIAHVSRVMMDKEDMR